MSEKRLRRDAIAVFRAAVKAADPEAGVRRVLERTSTERFNRVFIVGAGKAAATMGRAAERTLGKRIAAGFVNTKYGHSLPLHRIEVNECGHPVPDEAGVRGARKIADICGAAAAGDLVVCLISGGGSALMPLPAAPVTLAEKQETTKRLLACGATIHEINAVRKHISAIKGGQLARLAAPATVLSLLLSDVVGDPLDVIASGPAAPDESTFASAWAVIEKYGIQSRIPASVRSRLQSGLQGAIAETPKPGERCFRSVKNVITGSARQAVDAAAAKARELGYRPLVLSSVIEGETREIARMHAAIAKEVRSASRPTKPPACLISGGETTVTIRGDGLGGRNQEFALASALELSGQRGMVAFSGGTDGTDGPTDAAGAIADGFTVERARSQGLEPSAFLARNDSYRFFDPLGDLVKTGPTGTNVMDIRLLLIA
jgi:hydroxypyruvate reductase